MPKLQPTLVNIVAVVLCTLFLAGVVIMIAIFHRLKIKRYGQFCDDNKHYRVMQKLLKARSSQVRDLTVIFFLIFLILPAALGPGVHSTS
jgi:hypothetical protein